MKCVHLKLSVKEKSGKKMMVINIGPEASAIYLSIVDRSTKEELRIGIRKNARIKGEINREQFTKLNHSKVRRDLFYE